jgi:lysyl-tRNA synthetase class 1
MIDKIIDRELLKLLEEREKKVSSKIITVSAGTTSSGLGDERNLREFLLADNIANYFRKKGKNVFFYLFDDSFDPLTHPKLKVGVKKDGKLIKQFEKYYGTPVKLVPDPYRCHDNYSAHFQEEIISRFHNLGIFPTVIDVWSLYQHGQYDFAKEIVFKNYSKIHKVLKKHFPNYTMSQIFSVLCPKCNKIDNTRVMKVEEGQISAGCDRCHKKIKASWKEIKGKFSWKIDSAVKWNLFKPDFEPFLDAYLDPVVGSYLIAKVLSEEFFGGYFPEAITIGKINVDRNLSFSLLPTCPRPVMDMLFLTNRITDVVISEKRVIGAAKNTPIEGDLSYYDYVRIKLPYDNIDFATGKLNNEKAISLINFGREFSKKFLSRNLQPQLPSAQELEEVGKTLKKQHIIPLISWIIKYKAENSHLGHDKFLKALNKYLEEHKISRSELFPIIRKIILVEESIPLSRLFFFSPIGFLHDFLSILLKDVEKSNERL